MNMTTVQTFKKADETSVKIAMDLLIHANGKTSTKEVKDLLRTLGFFASQREVSQMMDDQFNNGDSYLRAQVNAPGVNYFEYTFSAFRAMSVGIAEECDADGNVIPSPALTVTPSTPVASPANTASASSGKNDIASSNANFKSTFLGNANTGTAPAPKASVAQATAQFTPLIEFYSSNLARAYVTDPNTWVVTSTDGNEIQLFDGSLSRDNVRGAYSKATGIKKDNTRACRFSNY